MEKSEGEERGDMMGGNGEEERQEREGESWKAREGRNGVKRRGQGEGRK